MILCEWDALEGDPGQNLRSPVCSYPIDVFQLSFNFLCLLLLYSIYLNGFSSQQASLQSSQRKEIRKEVICFEYPQRGNWGRGGGAYWG
jgi:hypothetical protein